MTEGVISGFVNIFLSHGLLNGKHSAVKWRKRLYFPPPFACHVSQLKDAPSISSSARRLPSITQNLLASSVFLLKKEKQDVSCFDRDGELLALGQGFQPERHHPPLVAMTATRDAR